MIYKNLKKLHTDELLRLKELVPFSPVEDSILLCLESNLADMSNEFFEKILMEKKVYFYEARTPASLKKQWNLFKKLNLLKDQVMSQCKSSSDSTGENPDLSNLNFKKDMFNVNYSQIEASLDDKEIMENVEVDNELEKAMTESYNVILGKIKRSEADLFLWQCLVDKVTCNENPFLDNDTLAVVFNDKFTYKIKKSQIFIGRSTKNSHVDIDLSDLEANKKISRNQCSINMIEQDAYVLLNNGKLPMYVDGKIILKECKTHIYDKSIIEVKNFFCFNTYLNVVFKSYVSILNKDWRHFNAFPNKLQ